MSHILLQVFNKDQHRPTHGDIRQFICAPMWVHCMQSWTIQVDTTQNKSSTYVTLVSKKEYKIKTNNNITNKSWNFTFSTSYANLGFFSKTLTTVLRSLPCYACISWSVSLMIATNQMERLLTLWCLHRVSCQSNNNYYAAVLNKNMQ